MMIKLPRNKEFVQSQDRHIQARVAEIQSVGAERAAITVESLIVEAEQARSKACIGDQCNSQGCDGVVPAKLRDLPAPHLRWHRRQSGICLRNRSLL
jgi:hypothetical protein